jgi:hypothetical protein
MFTDSEQPAQPEPQIHLESAVHSAAHQSTLALWSGLMVFNGFVIAVASIVGAVTDEFRGFLILLSLGSDFILIQNILRFRNHWRSLSSSLLNHRNFPALTNTLYPYLNKRECASFIIIAVETVGTLIYWFKRW